jgi:hypothetical protein
MWHSLWALLCRPHVLGSDLSTAGNSGIAGILTLSNTAGQIIEPAAFNGMLRNAAGPGPLVMPALDIVDVHIWAPSPDAAYREQVRDETSGETSSVLVLNSPGDGPLTPEFSTQEIGNALDWGAVWDTPMAFVYEIGHSFVGPTPLHAVRRPVLHLPVVLVGWTRLQLRDFGLVQRELVGKLRPAAVDDSGLIPAWGYCLRT